MENKEQTFSVTRIDNDKYQLRIAVDKEAAAIDLDAVDMLGLTAVITTYLELIDKM